MRFWIAPHTGTDKTFPSPFWHVQTLDNEGDANINAKLHPDLEDHDETEDFPPVIIVPLITNTKTVGKGTSIFIHKRAIKEELEFEPLKKMRKRTTTKILRARQSNCEL